MSASLRSRPNLRTAANRRGVPKAESCTAANSTLLDHLVGAREQRRRDREADAEVGIGLHRCRSVFSTSRIDLETTAGSGCPAGSGPAGCPTGVSDREFRLLGTW
jgi:hypothetical protein